MNPNKKDEPLSDQYGNLIGRVGNASLEITKSVRTEKIQKVINGKTVSVEEKVVYFLHEKTDAVVIRLPIDGFINCIRNLAKE